MNILFLHGSRHELTPWRDGSTRYRCYHLAESLRQKGHIADIAPLTDVRIEHLNRYRTVCVLRPRPSKTLDQILKRCRRLGIRTVADVDDLVFIPRYSALSPSVINDQATELSVRAQFKRNLQAMLCFDEITVATEPLAHHWREQTGRSRVSVIPNGLSMRWLDTPVSRQTDPANEGRTITYLPGSNSHNRDFSEIVDVLADFVNRDKNIRLLIVGSLNTDERKFPKARLSRSPWIDYFKLPQIIASSSVTLAPLVKSPFTHAKSHIKFIESAAFGTPAICSPNHDICRHDIDGLHIANTVDDWHAALQRTLDPPHDSAELSRMKSYVRQNATAGKSADTLLAHWKKEGSQSLQNVAV
ncbi:glycosyltransferase [Granulosicoccus sp. 3-233]|uniref:glycosyltransferase n=1 Tax=Granulosicoccus sp. 3-233 TaxID=3417969 RepID=UPI003D3493CA